MYMLPFNTVQLQMQVWNFFLIPQHVLVNLRCSSPVQIQQTCFVKLAQAKLKT